MQKIDINLSDLKPVDIMKNLEHRLKNSYNMSKAFLWLCIKFINEKRTSVTSKELSDDLFQNSAYSYNLLKEFISFSILKRIKVKGKTTVWVCTNPNILNEYSGIAKEIINGRNK